MKGRKNKQLQRVSAKLVRANICMNVRQSVSQLVSADTRQYVQTICVSEYAYTHASMHARSLAKATRVSQLVTIAYEVQFYNVEEAPYS